TLAINQQLSEQRALAVAQILVNTGTPSARVRYLGRAFYEPIASNASAAGRAANRRVEIIITPNR
ncbi:MAG: OmpA family protein, partial [Phaeovulum sp.]